MKHISIVIVDFNSHADTLECLSSLEKIKKKNFTCNTLVVDNGSLKPLKLKSGQFRHSLIVRSDANLGFTGGNNLGIHKAIELFNSDFVLLLNNDTTVDPNFLVALIDQAEEHPELGLTSAKIYFYPRREFHTKSYSTSDRGRVIWYAGGSVDWQHLTAFHRGVDEIDRGQFDHQLTSDFATGCCLLIKREVLEKVGFLDKRFFLYFEDTDLSLRTKESGYQIGFCPQALIWHKNAGSSGGSGSITHQYYQERNRLLLALLHGDLKAKMRMIATCFRYLVTGSKWQRLAVWHLISRQFGKQPLV